MKESAIELQVHVPQGGLVLRAAMLQELEQ